MGEVGLGGKDKAGCAVVAFVALRETREPVECRLSARLS